MKKRSLIWIAPAIAAALSVAYIGTAPELPGEPVTRPSLTEAESVAQIERTSRRRIVENDDSAAAPEPEATGCTVESLYLPREDGTTVELYTCEPNSPEEKHAYEGYSNDTLASLAYSDAKAAEMLGMRLREDDEEVAMSLTFRASALSDGNPAPILAFSNAYPHPSSVNGVPVRKTIHKKFVMSAVADMLGAPANNLDFWEYSIRKWSSDPEREIAMLHSQAREILDEMRQIQLDVTGSSNIGGQDDA